MAAVPLLSNLKNRKSKIADLEKNIEDNETDRNKKIASNNQVKIAENCMAAMASFAMWNFCVALLPGPLSVLSPFPWNVELCLEH